MLLQHYQHIERSLSYFLFRFIQEHLFPPCSLMEANLYVSLFASLCLPTIQDDSNSPDTLLSGFFHFLSANCSAVTHRHTLKMLLSSKRATQLKSQTRKSCLQSCQLSTSLCLWTQSFYHTTSSPEWSLIFIFLKFLMA